MTPYPSSKSQKFAIRDADLKLFTVLWNQCQGQSTPAIHLWMADWLEHAWVTKRRRLLLMAFRSSGKSTMVGIFAAWLLYRNPDLRILVLAADFTLAKKMVRNVKRIIERHPLTKKMKPAKADQWASDRFSVKRTMVLRDPSMIAKGVSSNITGSRADIVICDDVEVPNTCDTMEKRSELRERLAEIPYVLADGSGMQLYVGTPHTYFTIYADAPRQEIGEEQSFLHGFHNVKIPVLDKAGECVWPERYGDEQIEEMKRQTGPNKFASQMMLEPVNIAEGRLDVSKIQIYKHELDYAKELQTLFLGQTKLVSASAWWDPAFGSIKGDGSVLAVLFADGQGNAYVHRLEYIKTRALDDTDEATQQCRIVAAIAKELMLPSLTLETNGIGKFLPAILRNELAKAKAPCAVKEFSNSRPKDLRILEAFDAVLAAKRLFIHKAVLQTPFMVEMREWRPKSAQGRSRSSDDGLDAVAGALSQQPARIERLYSSGGHSWMGNAKAHKANTDFKI